ncbi:hypothetical protein QQP08_011027, partial [Theobroma cacao]
MIIKALPCPRCRSVSVHAVTQANFRIHCPLADITQFSLYSQNSHSPVHLCLPHKYGLTDKSLCRLSSLNFPPLVLSPPLVGAVFRSPHFPAIPGYPRLSFLPLICD